MEPYVNASSKLLSCLSLSKEQFYSQYCKFQGKTEAKSLYLLVLVELKKAVTDGDVKIFKHISNCIESIHNLENNDTLKNFFSDISNPVRSTNFVILACKHNTIKILEHIFRNFDIFENVTKDVVPSDLDEACHNCFYYAISSGNLELLEMLINRWPKSYFAVQFTELDKILSTAYEELKLKNVPLSEEMELFVENKLISLRFFSSGSQAPDSKNNSCRLEERVQLVLENIALLIEEYYSDSKEVDERFLYVGKFIIQNIHILKRSLKSTYDKLPWEEIEFCFVCYISSFIKHQEINLVSCALINKCRILDHLQNFANKLKCVFEATHSLKYRDISNLNRERVIQQIVKNDPLFEPLYNDYQRIRDVHSLETINKYINVASLANLQNKEGQLIIIRVLQVIGEYFKNTLESPKLSKTTSELLLLSLPKNTRALIINLRNSISHAHSLLSRIEIEKNMSIDFFIGVQNDIKKIGFVISDILYRNKFKTIKMLLNKIVSSEKLDEINEVLHVLTSFKLNDIDSVLMTDSDKLENLILELNKIVINKTHDEQKLFDKIIDVIHLDKSKSESDKSNYNLGVRCLQIFPTLYSEIKIDDNRVKSLKFCASQALQHMVLEMKPDNLKEISFLIQNIFKSVVLKNMENHDEILKLFFEIRNIVEFDSNNVKWIEKLREKLSDRNVTQKEAFSLSEEQFHKQLKIKLSELKNILNTSGNVTIENMSNFKSNKKLQAAVEMLVLDIISILDSFKRSRLENNIYFLDDTIPILIGKCLRNHLAHDNAVVSLLLSDPVITLLLNAKSLVVENIIKNEEKIGKFVVDDILHLKLRYNQNLFTITNQKNMFVALENGNRENLEKCIKHGADVNARNLNSWTALHFAAKGTCVSLIKFIFELLQSSDCNVKTVNGRNPLHVATIYGRKDVVEYFVKALIPVNDVDIYGKTPLHIAAENGHKATVEILLNHDAATCIKDLQGLSPVHYAVRKGHVDVVKILLLKEKNVDFNEIQGGFTLLHEAAEKGHLELVHFLIENGANVNAKDDRHWTPLHFAAFEGHLEIVNVLILKGAEVNGPSLNGWTALHFAVENGQVKIVNVLLKLRANVNAYGKTSYFTPLHVAAEYGYEEIFKILLNHKANANFTTIEGLTALHIASEKGYVEIAMAALEHGVNIDTRNKALATSLHYACKNGHSIVVKLLLENKALITAKDCNHFTSLHLAALGNHKDVAEILIENNIEIDTKAKEGYSALHIAAINCSINIMDLLIKNKADVNSTDNFGLTPLHSAVFRNLKQVVKVLINSGAKVNTKVLKKGYTPLHTAAGYGFTDIMDILIKNLAEIDAKDIDDNTPLHVAVEAGFKEAVKVLIVNGAHVNAMNIHKISPLLSAVKHNYKDIVEYLISNKADVDVEDHKAISVAVNLGYVGIVKILIKNKAELRKNYDDNYTLLHIAAARGSAEIVKALVVEGCDIDAKTISDLTPLYVATVAGYEEIVEFLIVNGAIVDVKSDDGTTPLHAAATKGHVGIVKLLLNNNANAEIKDNINRFPLELAVAHGHLEVVKILTQCSSDINAKGNEGWTVLHIAAQQTDLEIIKYLITKGADVSAKNTAGSKPIHIAAREGFNAAVEFFLNKGCNINELGTDNQTLLHYATMKGQLEMVRYLIAQGAEVNAKDDNGLTPMHFAARFGYKDILECLLVNGAIYNIHNSFNLKPSDMSKNKDVLKLLLSTEKLFEAVKHNNQAEAENSIKAGAFVNARNATSGTPLHYAASKGSIEIVDMLLKHKADPNAIGDKGHTPLHYAAKLSHVNVVEALLCNGAIHNAMSVNGKTPLDFATNEKITFLLKLACKSFKGIKNKSFSVINDLNKVKDLQTIKAVMNARDRENRTLVVAAIHNNFPKVELLKEVFQNDVAARLNMAIKLKNEGQPEKALNIFKDIFERRKEILGADNPGTVDIQAYMAEILFNQGSYYEALNHFEDVYQKRKQDLGLNDINTLLIRSSIALTLYRLDRNEEALKIFREVYQKQKEVLGPNHEVTVDTNFHMALVLDGLGKYEEALSINQEVYKREKGANNIRAVRAQNNIALVLANQGKLEEALKMFNEVLEKKKFLLGMTHSDTLRTLDHIAQIHFLQKKYPDALKAHEEILNTKKKVLGQNHPLTLTSQYNIANVLFTQNKWIAALKLFKEISHRRKSIFGPNDPTFLDISAKIKLINKQLKMDGKKESDVLQWLQTDMNLAANNGDVQCIEYLIKNGADVNDNDVDGRTPLHYAVSNGHLNIITILLKSGADVTRITNKGNTPLHTAALKGNEDIVRNLLEQAIYNPSFINAQTTISGNTALHVAAKIGSLDIVLLLLKHGAMFNIQNKEGKTACDLAKIQSIISLLKLVDTFFQEAKMGDEQIIKKLKALKHLEFVSITNTRNNQANTLLQVAISNKHKSISCELLKMLKNIC